MWNKLLNVLCGGLNIGSLIRLKMLVFLSSANHQLRLVFDIPINPDVDPDKKALGDKNNHGDYRRQVAVAK